MIGNAVKVKLFGSAEKNKNSEEVYYVEKQTNKTINEPTNARLYRQIYGYLSER